VRLELRSGVFAGEDGYENLVLVVPDEVSLDPLYLTSQAKSRSTAEAVTRVIPKHSR